MGQGAGDAARVEVGAVGQVPGAGLNLAPMGLDLGQGRTMLAAVPGEKGVERPVVIRSCAMSPSDSSDVVY